MKKNDINVLIEGLRKLSRDAAEIADQLAGEQKPEPKPVEAPPAKQYSKEEVRAILADKSRAGFRAEVKALLTAHGVKQFSEITEPEVLAQIVAEAEVIGSA